ncbi:hypothetical protein EMPS_02441 [Entomortierella parvispora]|uniref:SUZ domain-containing protein n=1 Tax=Entomortierella parvispora TaxID=205924 RepID=A0A9P3H4W0_9FUNG|nr:hypothetical protein EMPS_02441 [Entomortierella parvispora]
MAAASSSSPLTSPEEQRVPDQQSSSTMTDQGSPQIDSPGDPKDTPPFSPTTLGDDNDASSLGLLELDQCLKKMQVQDTAGAASPCHPQSPVSQQSPCCGPAESLDEFLLTALKNKQNRLFLLKLEREFCCYLEGPSQQPLEFPWVNSYYRMMIHRSAIYFQLSRKVDPLNKQITLSKNRCSAIPVLRFSDLVEEDEEEERTCQEEPTRPVQLLKRCPTRPISACEPHPRTTATDRRSISIEQREQDYAEARARIFKSESPVEGTDDADGPCSQSSTKSSLVRRSSATSCSSSGTSMTEASASSEVGSSTSSSSTSSSSTGAIITDHGQPLNCRAKPFQRSKATAAWASGGNSAGGNSVDKSSRQIFASDPTWTCTGHDCQCATCSRYSYRPNEYYHHHQHQHQHQHPAQTSQYPMQPMPGWSNHTQGLPYNPSRRTPQCGNQSHEQQGGNFGQYHYSQFTGPPPAPPPVLNHGGPSGYYHQTHPECSSWCDAHQACHDHQVVDNPHMANQNHAWGQQARGCSTVTSPVQVVPPPSPQHMAPMTLTVRPYPSANGYRPCRQGIDVFQQQYYQQHPQQQQHPMRQQRHHQHSYPPMSQSGGQQQNTLYPDSQSQMHHYQLRPQQHLQHTHHRVVHHGGRQSSHHHYPGRAHSVSHSQETSSPIEIEPHTGASLHQHPPRVPRNTPPRASFLPGVGQRNAHTRDSGSGSRGAGSVVYDVDRRPPKSTELYDPYADRSTPSGNHSTSSFTKTEKH